MLETRLDDLREDDDPWPADPCAAVYERGDGSWVTATFHRDVSPHRLNLIEIRWNTSKQFPLNIGCVYSMWNILAQMVMALTVD